MMPVERSPSPRAPLAEGGKRTSRIREGRVGCLGLLGTLLAVASIVISVPPGARAAVEGSPHDLISQGYDVPRGGGSQERCTVCHAAARSGGQGLAFEVPPSLQARYGAGSLLCFSCHDGITFVAPDVDASLTAFHPAAHGHDLAAHRGLQEQGADLPSLEGGHMECTSCHDPHDNSRRPFLRVPIFDLCLRCHLQHAELPTEEEMVASGNHPIGRDPAAVASLGMPIQIAGEFAVAVPSSYPLQKGKGSVGSHWDLGGHLREGSSGELGCGSCHAVHGDESAPPVSGLLAKDRVGDLADEFCEGCHRGARGDAVVSGANPNPGGTVGGRTYHPCDDDAANGEGRIVAIRVPADWPFGGGTPARLLCSTCHRAHGAEAGTQLLRAPVQGGSFCRECHDQLPLEYHHPTGEVEGKCADLLEADAVNWSVLSCERCHRAHNAGLGSGDEPDFVPLLREGLSSMALCTSCHPRDNPTCGTDATRQASHFMGDPGAMDTYEDADPPLRTEPWPESTLMSSYGKGEGGDTLICLSCHAFRQGAVVSGDLGDSGFLLARSGKGIEWSEGGESTYLCLGCHGVTPGKGKREGGHTHPLMSAEAAKLGREIAPPASITPAGRVNCDSCHRPHEAITKGGYYILEKVDGSNEDPLTVHPKIDFTVTCHLCHDPKKY